MRKILTAALCSVLAACGGGESGSSGTSNPSVTRAYSFFDTAANFATPATRNATVTVNGASTSIVFSSPAVTISTIDNWNSNTWTGTAGNFSAEKADGNFLRICSAVTAAGTAAAVSANMVEIAASSAAGRTVLANKVFQLQDCTGSINKTWTFSADGSTFTSSDGTAPNSAIVDALFSPTGWTDTSTTPAQTTRVKVYSMAMSGGTGYFLVNLNTDGVSNKVITANVQ